MKSFFLRVLVILLFLLSTYERSFSQIPTTCFEITRLMVDACGSEPDNEMVYFTVGPNPLNTSSLTITWPSNPFLGIIQNTTTAGNVAGVNALITSCGHILEPIGGVLPAGKKVILVTSDNMSVGAYSFANLTDTVYMIFQNAGASSGHLKNYQAGAGPRTVLFSFGAGCSDAVTYMVDSLINQSGIHSAQDGATVFFDFAGNATAYTNPGCQEVVVPVSDTVSANSYAVCPGASINLSGAVLTGNYLSTLWYGGHGSVLIPASANSPYVTNGTYLGSDSIFFAVIGNCLDTLRDTLIIQVSASAGVTISPSGPTTFCTGSSVILTASGATTYLWAPGGETTPSITVTASGTYTVTASGACGTSSNTQTVTVVPGSSTVTINPPGPTILCQGDSILLTAVGIGTYLWSNGSTSQSIYTDTTGIFTVTLTSGCGTSSASEAITISPVIPVQISASGPATFCEGGQISLTASGGGPYTWSTGSTTNNIIVTGSGTVVLIGNSLCGSDTASITIQMNPKPTASITSNHSVLCPGETIVLTASGGANYLWSNGSTSDNIEINSPGTYSLTATNACGNSSGNITISGSSLSVSFTQNTDQGGVPFIPVISNNSFNAASYLWNFGDSTHSSDSNPIHTFTEKGSYTVRLTGTDQNGCSLEFTHVFTVSEEDDSLTTPNIFSPNNDGLNELFTISGTRIANINGKIYSRWGKEVFSWNSITEGWNGKTKSGSSCTDGTYFYLISVTMDSGETKVVKGFVELGR